MELIEALLRAFFVGGLICAVGQLLIDYTPLTPARILVSFVVLGVVLGGIGIYQPLLDFAGAGARCRSPASEIGRASCRERVSG